MNKMRVEGLVVVLITVGYTCMTMTSLIKWNEATSGALIMGYAIFAQTMLKQFFATPEDKNER